MAIVSLVMKRALWFPIIVPGLVLVGPKLKAQSTLNVSFRLECASVTLHEPVWVELMLHNTLGETVNVDLGFDQRGNSRFKIAAPSGSTVEPTVKIEEGVSRGSTVPLRPDQHFSERILLTRLYSFPETGHYIIEVNLEGPAWTRLGRAVALAGSSAELDLRVAPRNEQALDDTCRKLAEAAVSAKAERWLESAEALSYVPDLIAVSYLERVASEGPFVFLIKPMAIHGLARLAQAEGLDAVVSRLRHRDPQMRASIAAVLEGETRKYKPAKQP